MAKYRIKWFIQEHIAIILVVLLSAAFFAVICIVNESAYQHGTLAVYDTYGNVKHVISGDFKRNTDDSFTCKNGTVYKFENMLFERM